MYLVSILGISFNYKDHPYEKKLAKLLWQTGLSWSDKATLSNSIYKDLLKNNFEVLKIDNDIFRKKTKNINNFSKKNIAHNNSEIISYVKKLKKDLTLLLYQKINLYCLQEKKAKNTFDSRYFKYVLNAASRNL